MKKYAIFSDVDGTIYDHKNIVMPETVTNVKQAQEKGVEFIIATGNPYFVSMNKLGKLFNSHYIITANGASIVDLHKNTFIRKEVMSKNDCQAMLDKAAELQLGSDWWDADKLFFNKFVLPEIVKFWSGRDEYVVEVTDKIHEAPFKIEFYDTKDRADRIDAMIGFLKQFNVQVAHMQPHHIEVTAPHVSKGAAIKWLTKYLGIPIENTMGVGDSANDFSMFETVAYSYVMGSAPKHAKEKAKYITGNVLENGMGQAVIDFLKKTEQE